MSSWRRSSWSRQCSVVVVVAASVGVERIVHGNLVVKDVIDRDAADKIRAVDDAAGQPHMCAGSVEGIVIEDIADEDVVYEEAPVENVAAQDG